MAKDKKTTIIFLSATFFITFICYLIYFHYGENASPIAILLMFCPSIVAIIIKKIYYKKENVLGMNGCNLKFIFVSLFIPIIYLGISYIIYWISNFGSFTWHMESENIIFLILDFLFGIVLVMGEEIGWRGFLLTRMNKLFSIKWAIILNGLVWALWHYPAIIGGIYSTNTPLWYQLPMFTISTILITAIMAKFRFNAKSLWPVILLHGSHNYINQMLESMTNSQNGYLVGEAGIITLTCIGAITLIMYKKKYVK